MNTKTGRKTWITCLGVLAACGIAITAPPAYAQYKEILKTTTSKNGKSVDFPKTNAEITAAVVELPPGSVRPRTTHPWPRYVYVIEGTLTVGGDDGKATEYPAGSLLVTQNSWDIPKNVGDKSVKLLVIDSAALAHGAADGARLVSAVPPRR